MNEIIDPSKLNQKQYVALGVAFNFIYDYIKDLSYDTKIRIDRNAFKEKNKNPIEKAFIFSTDKIISLTELNLLSENLDQMRINGIEASIALQKSYNNSISDLISDAFEKHYKTSYENVKGHLKKMYNNLHEFIKSNTAVKIAPLEENKIENYITKDLSDLLPIYGMFIRNAHRINMLEKTQEDTIAIFDKTSNIKLDPFNQIEAFLSRNITKIRPILTLDLNKYRNLMGWLSFIGESFSSIKGQKNKLITPDFINLFIGIHHFYNQSNKTVLSSLKEIDQLKELIDLDPENKKVFNKLSKQSNESKDFFSSLTARESEKKNLDGFINPIWKHYHWYPLVNKIKKNYPLTFTIGYIRGNDLERIQHFKDLHEKYVIPHEKEFERSCWEKPSSSIADKLKKRNQNSVYHESESKRKKLK